MVVSGYKHTVRVRAQTAVPRPSAMEPFCGVARDSEISREPAPVKGCCGDFADLINIFGSHITQFNSSKYVLFAIAASILAQCNHGDQHVKADLFQSAELSRIVRRDSREDAVPQVVWVVLEAMSGETRGNLVARLLAVSTSKQGEISDPSREHCGVPRFVLQAQSGDSIIGCFREQSNKDGRLKIPVQERLEGTHFQVAADARSSRIEVVPQKPGIFPVGLRGWTDQALRAGLGL